MTNSNWAPNLRRETIWRRRLASAPNMQTNTLMNYAAARICSNAVKPKICGFQAVQFISLRIIKRFLERVMTNNLTSCTALELSVTCLFLYRSFQEFFFLFPDLIASFYLSIRVRASFVCIVVSTCFFLGLFEPFQINHISSSRINNVWPIARAYTTQAQKW